MSVKNFKFDKRCPRCLKGFTMHLRLRVKDAPKENGMTYLCESCTKWRIRFNRIWFVRLFKWKMRILKSVWNFLTTPFRWTIHQIRYAIYLTQRSADYALQRVYKVK